MLTVLYEKLYVKRISKISCYTTRVIRSVSPPMISNKSNSTVFLFTSERILIYEVSYIVSLECTIIERFRVAEAMQILLQRRP